MLSLPLIVALDHRRVAHGRRHGGALGEPHLAATLGGATAARRRERRSTYLERPHRLLHGRQRRRWRSRCSSPAWSSGMAASGLAVVWEALTFAGFVVRRSGSSCRERSRGAGRRPSRRSCCRCCASPMSSRRRSSSSGARSRASSCASARTAAAPTIATPSRICYARASSKASANARNRDHQRRRRVQREGRARGHDAARPTFSRCRTASTRTRSPSQIAQSRYSRVPIYRRNARRHHRDGARVRRHQGTRRDAGAPSPRRVLRRPTRPATSYCSACCASGCTSPIVRDDDRPHARPRDARGFARGARRRHSRRARRARTAARTSAVTASPLTAARRSRSDAAR